jgi:hypothetical protein
MWTPRATARARAVRQPARMRSSSHSAHDSIMRSTSRPWSVDRSNPSWTETNVPPAACMRSTAARLWISERPNRSSLATTSPSLVPDSIRAKASSSSGRSARAPEASSSSKTWPTCASRIVAQALIWSPWTTGEMKLSPSLPRSCDTRTYPSMTTPLPSTPPADVPLDASDVGSQAELLGSRRCHAGIGRCDLFGPGAPAASSCERLGLHASGSLFLRPQA